MRIKPSTVRIIPSLNHTSDGRTFSLWDIIFKVNGLYYGQHKDNKIASLSIYTESILYIPKPPNVDDIIDFLNGGGTKRKSEKNATSKRKSRKENC